MRDPGLQAEADQVIAEYRDAVLSMLSDARSLIDLVGVEAATAGISVVLATTEPDKVRGIAATALVMLARQEAAP